MRVMWKTHVVAVDVRGTADHQARSSYAGTVRTFRPDTVRVSIYRNGEASYVIDGHWIKKDGTPYVDPTEIRSWVGEDTPEYVREAITMARAEVAR